MSEAANIVPFAVPTSLEHWVTEGKELGERERSGRSLMWDIGDWWNRGEPYGERVQIVTAGDWKGPAHTTCWTAGSVAGRWPALTRVKGVTFDHHRAVAPLPDSHAISLLQWCAETDPPRSTSQLRTHVKQLRRTEREAMLAEAIEQASANVGYQLYGVLYADPAWRFAPYSVEGMDRAADNHYPTMPMVDLLDMEVMRVAPAENCVLFCWATVPMLEQALAWMAHYGFTYRSHCAWVKDRVGTGYWFRNAHELLLVGVKGDVPAPAPGTQFPSVIEASVGKHSEKPEAFAAMIESLFPNIAKLEMFARAPRAGWDSWGAEAETPDSNR
jgi:N6-adenosine-specific RNA methylase IME4